MKKEIEIEQSWRDKLSDVFDKEEFKELAQKVHQEYLSNTIYPLPQDIFNAFNVCPFDDIKVVILGQDPYHGRGQAHGFAFSVQDGVRPPPSLKNIFKEINGDLGIEIPENGNLTRWAKQGVLLLNAILTVRANSPTSHRNMGWEMFTDCVIETISKNRESVVFLLWGAFAKEKAGLIDKEKHLILTAAHPSPYSADRGFFGCKHFSKANDYLRSNGLEPISW